MSALSKCPIAGLNASTNGVEWLLIPALVSGFTQQLLSNGKSVPFRLEFLTLFSQLVPKKV